MRLFRVVLQEVKLLLIVAILAQFSSGAVAAEPTPSGKSPKFRVVAIAEAASIHRPFVAAAKVWLNEQAAKDNFVVDYLENTDHINDDFLSRYQVFIQLDYPPYGWTPTAQAAFVRYIEEGRGGWIGFHHATLLGEFDGYPIWPWFSEFMGGIRFKSYIPTFADAEVKVEDGTHPVMKGVSEQFEVFHEEWYAWDKSPAPNVHVLASVDEQSYKPDSNIKMGGSHPVIWSNERYKARNVYIFMGHHADHFQNKAYTTIFRNALFWAAHQ